jgi:hypothetical protein
MSMKFASVFVQLVPGTEVTFDIMQALKEKYPGFRIGSFRYDSQLEIPIEIEYTDVRQGNLAYFIEETSKCIKDVVGIPFTFPPEVISAVEQIEARKRRLYAAETRISDELTELGLKVRYVGY